MVNGSLTYDIYRNDDVDTRRELFYGIQRMPPLPRLKFLQCCAEEFNRMQRGRNCVVSDPVVAKAGEVVVRVRDTTAGDAREVYWDVCSLMVQGMPVESVMLLMVAFLKRLAARRLI